MGKKHFTEEQIAFAVRQSESDTPVAEVIRKLAMSEQTFYRWKKPFAALGIAELRRLRTLKEVSRKVTLWRREPRAAAGSKAGGRIPNDLRSGLA